MNGSAFRRVALAIGLLAAAPALGATATITVSARSGGGTATGSVATSQTTPPINCVSGSTASCAGTVTFTGSATITLTATPGPTALPPTWVGCTSVAGNVCTATVTGNRSITATFPPASYGLTARPTGTNGATGTVSVAVVPQVDCTTAQGSCVAQIPTGTTVAVTVAAGPNSSFTGWSGACTGTGACNVIGSAVKSVTASFVRSSYNVSLGFYGGTGAVTSTGGIAPSINCTSPGTGVCADAVAINGTIALTAAPDLMSTFTGWGGCTSVAGAVCTVANVLTDKLVTAGFQARACNSCHGAPPPVPHVQKLDCGGCHTGYTASTVNPATHLDGTVEYAPLTCTSCHGDESRGLDPFFAAAPPTGTRGESLATEPAVGAHQAHLNAGPLASAMACADCHNPPTDTLHATGEVEFSWSILASGGGTPTYNPTTHTCASTYCHGNFTGGKADNAPSWIGGSAVAECGSCHGLPPALPHTQSTGCAMCHEGYSISQVNPATHVNGLVDVKSLTCSSCHGSSFNPAPPFDTTGRTATTFASVGGHQAHAASTLMTSLTCGECHGTAANSYTMLHTDGLVQVSFNGRANGTAFAGASCASTYCHGANAPVWTVVNGTFRACTACHGAPPAAPHVSRSDCGTCHDGYGGTNAGSWTVNVAKHVDGTVDVSSALTCTECHPLQMASTASYHHSMAAEATYLGSYPTNSSPAVGSADRSCLMCHVRHDAMGGGSTLRQDIATAVAASDDASLCTSCHVHDQVKDAGLQKPDGTAATAGWIDTAGWNAASGLGHNYTVPGSFGSGGFTANCVKCHNAGSTTYQPGGYQFALHDGTDRRLRAALGRDLPLVDDDNEDFCYRCHSNTVDLLPGITKGADLRDWYGEKDMPRGSTGIYQQMVTGKPGTPSTSTATLYFKPAAQETVNGNQPSSWTPQDPTTMVTNTLYLRDQTYGTVADTGNTYLMNSGTYTGTTYRGRYAIPDKGSAGESQVTATGTAGYDRLFQVMSPPVATAFSFSNSAISLTARVQANLSTSSSNCLIRYAVYRWAPSNGPGNLPTPLLTGTTSNTSSSGRFPTTQGNQTFSFSSLSGNPSFAVGDRILVEAEIVRSGTTAMTCTVNFGNQGADASRIILPSTTAGNFPEFSWTNPGTGGSVWVVRSASPFAATTADESVGGTDTGVTTTYSTQFWHRASFVSPQVQAGVTIPGNQSWTLGVYDARGNMTGNNGAAYVRYRIFQWKADNTEGTEIVGWRTNPTAISSSSAGLQTIATPAAFTNPVTLAAGDKVIAEVEIETVSLSTAATVNSFFSFGSASTSSLVLPVAVDWAYATPGGGAPSYGHMGGAYTGIHKPNPAEETLAYISARKHTECSDCHDPHSARRGNQSDGGNLTSATTTTLTDTNQNWATNAWIGFWVDVPSVSGTNRAQVTGNGSNQLTFSPALGATPAASAAYRISMRNNADAVSASTSSTLTSSTNFAWQTSTVEAGRTPYKGWTVSIVMGTGVGQFATIASNTADVVTIVGTWATTPDTTSKYVITKLPNVLAGASGVGVWGWGTGTPTAWNSLNAFSVSANSPIPDARTQWQVCFKCHSAANTSHTTWKPLWTNLDQEFNPRNQSYHPVVAAAGAVSGTGFGNTVLTTAQLTNGWKPGDLMYCSDCHGNDDTGYGASQGPHASAVKYLLRGPNTRWPFKADGTTRWAAGGTFTAGNGTKDGLFCLNCHALTSVHTRSEHNNVACTSCHIVIPHGGKVKRLMRTTNTPAPYADTGSTAQLKSYAGGASDESTSCGATCTTRHNLTPSTTNSW
jgi:predicted CxxxxCH...CXXCH cytochrome family protein